MAVARLTNFEPHTLPNFKICKTFEDVKMLLLVFFDIFVSFRLCTKFSHWVCRPFSLSFLSCWVWEFFIHSDMIIITVCVFWRSQGSRPWTDLKRSECELSKKRQFWRQKRAFKMRYVCLGLERGLVAAFVPPLPPCHRATHIVLQLI